MSSVIKGASNLGKIASDYGMKVSTLKAIIAAYPELQAEIDLHTKDVKNVGQKTLPPVVVKNIYTILGEP